MPLFHSALKSSVIKCMQDIRNTENTDYFCLQSTLAFCMIGLKYTNPLVMPSDLVRWAKLGKVPFYNCADVLPSDMKLVASDRKIFCHGVSIVIILFVFDILFV